MSKLYDQLAGEIFDTLKGYGKILSLFDKDGNRVFAPSKARRVFCQPDKMMINLDENGEDSQVKMFLSQSSSLKDMQKLISTIRNISTRYNVLFNVRKFGKELCPRDFAYQSLPVQESLAESLWGTVKTSYDRIGSSKLVIKHTGPIDENKKGSRTRHIKSVFIETDRGERFCAPTNLRAARALARHTTMGGTPYDELGNIITSLAMESKALSASSRYLRRTKISEASNRVLESVHVRMDEIRELLQSLSKPKKYESIREALLSDNSLLNEDEDEYDSVSSSLSQIIGNDSTFCESMPYLIRAVMKEGQKTDKIDLLEEETKRDLVKTLQDEFGFKEGLDYSFSRTNPLRMTMTRRVSEEVISFLEEFYPGGFINEDKKMERIAIKPGTKAEASKALQNIGRLTPGKDFSVSDFSNTVFVNNPAMSKEIKTCLDKMYITASSGERPPITHRDESPTPRGVVLKKRSTETVPRGFVKTDIMREEDGKPKSKIEAWCDKWLDQNMPVSSSALNTSGDDAQIDSRGRDLARGIADFMTGRMSVNVKPVDSARFRSEQDAYNFKVGEVAETHFDNDIFSNFLATIYDKLMHGQKLSGPEKQVADKSAEYASVSEAVEEAFGDTGEKDAIRGIMADNEKIARNSGGQYSQDDLNQIKTNLMNMKKMFIQGGNPNGYRDYVDGFMSQAGLDNHMIESEETEDTTESHLNISFPSDGDDKVAKVLTAYFDDLNVLSNNVNDGRRNIVFDIPEDVDASGYTEKATNLLDGMGVSDTEVSMSGDSSVVGDEDGESESEETISEFAGDENDWNGGSAVSEGDMVSTPMGPGHVVEISGGEVKVEMMNGKVQSFHQDDVSSVNESVNHQIDEWFAQFDPKNIFNEDEDGADADDSDADEDSGDSDDSDLDGDASDAADSADNDLEEAFSDDPVGDADRYYGAQYGRQESADAALDHAADDFDPEEFIKIYGIDFGMGNIEPGAYPEDITTTDEEVKDSIAHYLTRLASHYDDADVSMEEAKPYAEDIFKQLKPQLEAKGLLFAKNEEVIPGNVQTDFRKDISNGDDPDLARMKELAGMNRR